MSKTYRPIITLIPSFGILIFIGLYIVSTQLYPGGSQNNLDSVGFDWLNNYWCNLMNPVAINGQPNPNQSIATTALIILSISIFVFFFLFAKIFTKSSFWKKIIPWFGGLTMIFTSLISTQHHDIMTTLSSLSGILVVIGIIWEVYKSKLKYFKTLGMVGIGLMVLNNYIYYSLHGIVYLPLLQKLTFAYILIWIIGLNFEMVKNRLVQDKTESI